MPKYSRRRLKKEKIYLSSGKKFKRFIIRERKRVKVTQKDTQRKRNR